MSFLFSNPTQDKVERATSETLLGPNQNYNAAICQDINRDPSLCKDAAKAIRKRLQNKNPKIALLTLSLLDAMMQNCVSAFHKRVGTEDFLNDFVNIALRRNENEVRMRMLELIECWGVVFQGRADVPYFQLTYVELREGGTNFPQTNVPARSPENYKYLRVDPASATRRHSGEISRDPAQQYASQRASRGSAHDVYNAGPRQNAPVYMAGAPNPYANPGGYAVPAHQYARPPQPAQPAAPAMTPQQIREKIRSDLSVAKGTVNLFSETLGFIDPNAEDVKSNELISEFQRNTKDIQHRVMKLIETVTDEELLPELLSLNDEAVRCLNTYDSMVKKEPVVSTNLIDIGIPTQEHSQPRQAAQTKPTASQKPVEKYVEPSDEFDSFISSRVAQSNPVLVPPVQQPVSQPPAKETTTATTLAPTQAPKLAQPAAAADVFDEFDQLVISRAPKQTPANTNTNTAAAPATIPASVTTNAAPPTATTASAPEEDDFDLLVKRTVAPSKNPMVLGPDTAKAAPASNKSAVEQNFEDVFGL